MATTLSPTKEQQAIIDYDASLVAIAKPGSGKTFVLSQLIKKILPSLPQHSGVIAISYTNKASNELKRRSSTSGTNTKSSFFGTIDSFCSSEIIIPFLTQLWGKPVEEISIIKISDLPDKDQEAFSDIHENTVSMDDVESHLSELRSYYLRGILFLETTGALAQHVIQKSTACTRYLSARYSHVIVDEYQDSGLEQHELFLQLQTMGLVAVAVGDPDQSIFGFSNKDPKYLLSLAKNSGFKTFPINKNHRSHPSIVNYSSRLLDKQADLIESDATRVFHKHCNGGSTELANWIDRSITTLQKRYTISKLSDIAILVRSSRSGHELDSKVKSKHRYFETHALENHLSLWANLFTALLTYRYNKTHTIQDIIDATAPRLKTAEKKGIKAKVRQTRKVSKEKLYDHLIDIADRLLPNAFSQSAINLLQQSEISSLADYFSPAKDDELQIMTLHKSKGLEYDLVFHLDLHEWVLPYQELGPDRDFDNPIFPSWDQDLNLHYVGATRARKALVLCTSDKRLNYKREIKRAKPSKFLMIHGLAQLRKTL